MNFMFKKNFPIFEYEYCTSLYFTYICYAKKENSEKIAKHFPIYILI